MYPFSLIDPNTLRLVAIGMFSITGLFMALAHHIRRESAYAWLAAGCLAFAIGWSLNLTGTYNRRAFLKLLGAELQYQQDRAHPVSVLLFDIDGFKAVNDAHGHGAGDAVILAVIDMAERECRKSDVIARYGGDEFTLLLRETHLEEAIAIADAIRRRIASAQPRTAPYNLTTATTCSFGVACSNGHDDTPQSLLAAADLALYEAKRNGRNRVEPPPGQNRAEGTRLSAPAGALAQTAKREAGAAVQSVRAAPGGHADQDGGWR